MPLFDRIAAAVVLASTGGALVVRAFRAWREYRLQRRQLNLLIRSITEIGEPTRERRP